MISQFTFICFCALLISGCAESDAVATSTPALATQEFADLGSLGSLQGLARSYSGMASDAVKQSLITQNPIATVDAGQFEACANQEAEGMFTLVAVGLWGESVAGVLHTIDGTESTWLIAVTDPMCEVVVLIAQDVDVVSPP